MSKAFKPLQGISGGVKAARAGHQVIMTPTSHCYLDYRQSLRAGEPGAWCECPLCG
jgi:hexosaminidase